MSTNEQIDILRTEMLSPQQLIGHFRRYNTVSLSKLPQGYGKSRAAWQVAISQECAQKFGFVIIAVDSKKRLAEYESRIPEAPTGSSVIVLHGRNDDDCPVYSDVKSLIDDGFFKLASELCDECTVKCPYWHALRELQEEHHGMVIIICTQAFLQRSLSLRYAIKGARTLLILDEPAFVKPSAGNNFLDIDLSVIETAATRYRQCGSSEKIQALATMCETAAHGDYDISATQIQLTLNEERLLRGRGLSNFSETVWLMHTRRPVIRNGKCRVRRAWPIEPYGLLIAATGVSPRLLKRVFPWVYVKEIVPGIEQLSQPGTKFYRINDSAGAAVNFVFNADRLCEFTGQLAHNMHTEGRTVLIVTRKKFMALVVEKVNSVFTDISSPLTAVPYKMGKNVVPVIHFGLAGVNEYENINGALAVNSYNINPQVVAEHLSFLANFQNDFDTNIENIEGERVVSALLSAEDRKCAGDIMHLYEAGEVIQTVARVRPFTKPDRFVLTIQTTPIVSGEHVFNGLAEAREFFTIKTLSNCKKLAEIESVRQAKNMGMPISCIAREFGLSRTTVYKYLHQNIVEFS